MPSHISSFSRPHLRSSHQSLAPLVERSSTDAFKLVSPPLKALILCVSLSALSLGCKDQVKVFNTPLELNLSSCLSSLNLTTTTSCAQGTGATPQGCFMMEGRGRDTVALPVEFLNGALLVSEESSGALEAQINALDEVPTRASLILFEEGAQVSCEAQRLSGECTRADDCALKVSFWVKEYMLGKGEIVQVDGEALCDILTPTSPVELCDSIDNDCDGLVDETFGLDEPCSNDLEGVCALEGRLVCDGLEEVTCVLPPAVSPSEERCDGLDNDCDGETDEELLELTRPCEAFSGLGVFLEGTPSCEQGALSCSASEVCDGQDNDLDGLIDEDFTAELLDEAGEPARCAFGRGTCQTEGVMGCVTTSEQSVSLGVALGQSACMSSTLIQPSEREVIGPCDGLDNDCDGFVDEHFVSEETSCGVGACQALGQSSCVEGREVNTCAPEEPAPVDALCDGVDDDCDGEVDEDFLSSESYCGVGECRRQGRVYCIGEELVNTCRAPSRVSDDNTCDGLDNDCDGAVDEGYVSAAVSCGQGVCQNDTGVKRCVGGAVIIDCEPGLPLGLDNTCDGADDDCDGLIDESYQSTQTRCGVGLCSQVGVQRCERNASGSREVNTCTPTQAATTLDPCDGLDNDCDGRLDESYQAEVVFCGQGACEQQGLRRCEDGQVVSFCFPLLPQSSEDTCDALDNDCDGSIDEDVLYVSCEGLLCIAEGVVTCQDGVSLNSCDAVVNSDTDGAVCTTPQNCVNTVCDGFDDDCDGLIDEDFVPSPDATETACDGLDDDCDGEVDEDYTPNVVSCGVGLCVNQEQTTCEFGQERVQCTPKQRPQPTDASCDGLDNDCDGLTDESFLTSATSCGQGACASQGFTVCSGGVIGDTCLPGLPSNDENCNLIDDDCDGVVDDDYQPIPRLCGVGECVAQGFERCTATGPQLDCTPLTPSSTQDLLCDGLDEDCDGGVDEDYVGYSITCGLGVCQNSIKSTCVSGQINTSGCQPLAPPAPDPRCPLEQDCLCDGFDDDCDGRIDEGYQPVMKACGAGACTLQAPEICTTAGLKDTCSYANSDVDVTCDGVDDDCDGQTDEDYVSTTSSETCGVGVCERTQQLECLNGAEQLSCVLNPPTGDDVTCDGLDNDCDGLTDEGYRLTISCGVGACVRQGVETCEGVQCTEGTPSAERCDGLDNDCDGQTDEDFNIGEACTSGEGECATQGQLVCASLNEASCNASPAPPSAELCDGLDNNCDGLIDNNPVGEGDSCLVSGLENTACHFGLLKCTPIDPNTTNAPASSELICESNVSVGDFVENYCTLLDEDCDPSTPSRVNGSNPTDNVPYLEQLYSVELDVRCSNQHKQCKWRCVSGELQCSRNGNLCPADLGLMP